MRQNLVLWGEIATDLKALLAIHLDEVEKKVTIHAFPKNELSDEVRDQLFNVWKNGGDYEFPEKSFQWEVNAEGDFSLPENIKLDRPQLLVNAQKDWLLRVQHAEILKLLHEEVNLLKIQADALTEYDQKIWNKTRALWDKVRKSQKEYKLQWEKVDELKFPINQIFDALKAFKRLSNEQSFEESLAMFKVFEKRIDDAKNDLIYPDKWNKIFNNLKLIQKDMKENQFKWKHRRQLQKDLNDVFSTLRNYRQVEFEKKAKDRVQHLKKTMNNLRSSIDRDKENYTMQVERMKHYTRGKMSDEEIERGLKSVRDKIKSKEKKLKDISKTLAQIKKKEEEKKKAEEQKKKEAEKKEAARKLAEEEKKKVAEEKEKGEKLAREEKKKAGADKVVEAEKSEASPCVVVDNNNEANVTTEQPLPEQNIDVVTAETAEKKNEGESKSEALKENNNQEHVPVVEPTVKEVAEVEKKEVKKENISEEVLNVEEKTVDTKKQDNQEGNPPKA